MKTLYIVRHAKSSWDHPGMSDDQRPLLEKGRKRTKIVVDFFLKNKMKPDLIISSHAVRALDTARIFANGLNYPENKIIISKNLYHSNVDNMIDYFYDLADDISSLMMFGHNPTFTYFANLFLDHKIDNLPTSGAVCIEFDTNKWEDIMNADKKTKFVVSPKLLKRG